MAFSHIKHAVAAVYSLPVGSLSAGTGTCFSLSTLSLKYGLNTCVGVLNRGNSYPILKALPLTCQHRFVSRKRQVRIPPKPLPFDLSGDRDLLPEQDLRDPTSKMQYSSLLTNAPEAVKQINSLQYANKEEANTKLLDETLAKFEHYPGDRDSLEVKIARLTIQLRNQISTLERNRHDTRGRNIMNHRLQRRRKYLKLLRREDYEALLRVCQELQIKYVPQATSEWPQSRRARRKGEVVEAAIALRREKLDALREQLGTEEQEYIAQKQEALRALERQLQALDPSLKEQDPELVNLQHKLQSLQLGHNQ